MPDPIHVEESFLKLVRELEENPSIRQQFQYIRDFIEILEGKYRKYDSYLMQLAEIMPEFRSVLTFTGIGPKEVEELLNKLKEVAKSVSELKESVRFEGSLRSLEKTTGILYYFAGEDKKGAEFLETWLNAENLQQALLNRDGSTSDSSDTSALKKLNNIFSYLLQSNQVKNKKLNNELRDIKNEVQSLIRHNRGSIFVPVVEGRKKLIDDSSNSWGRLRKINIRITGENEVDKDKIIRRFEIFGTEQPYELESNTVSDAVRKLYEHKFGSELEKYFKGNLEYELTGTYHQGSSYLAAVAALWFSEIQHHEYRIERFEVNSQIAITGGIDQYGFLIPVAEEGIKEKTKAAFYSWCPFLVVPKAQQQLFENNVQILRETYPERDLKIIGLEELKELFYDRRLTIHINPSKFNHYAKLTWKKKFEAAGIAIILIMAMAIFRLAYGPLDQNPVLYSFAGEVLQIKNQSEVKLETIQVGRQTVQRAERRLQSNFVVFHDVTGNGREDIIWAEIEEGENFRSSTLKSKSLGNSDYIWQKPLRYDLDFPGKPFVTERDYYPVKLAVNDSNKNSPRLVISADHVRYFPGILSVRDLQTGEEQSHFINTGRIQDFEITDLNNDGSAQIIFCGINNAFNMAFLAILNLDEVEGHSPLTDEYRVVGYEVNENIQYVLIPKTVVGQSVMTHRPYNVAESITLRREENIIQVNVTDFHQYRGSNVELPASQAYLLYNFDFDLNLIGVGTSDGYNLTSNFLYTNGMMDEYPDYRYFESYGERLLYWDGGGFVSLMEYLESR